ncbi:hypothetical protein [Endozoicomonas ascidiicola]|uniref:hypothetical protein n=1 Tax=Endozoicomonas ascidiicola TaxID=1698521 RepID=UPI0008320DE9|nr:hypothetical protein [Endozoicomonas ascidiicola]
MGPSGKIGGGSQAYIRGDKATQPKPRPAAKSWLAERFKQGPILVTIPREVQKSGFHHLFDRKVRALQAVSKVVSKFNKFPPLTLPGLGDRSGNKQSVDTKVTCPVSDIDSGEFECLSIDGANGQGSEDDDWCIVENSQRQAVGTESSANQTTPKIIVLPEHRGGDSEAPAIPADSLLMLKLIGNSNRHLFRTNEVTLTNEQQYPQVLNTG